MSDFLITVALIFVVAAGGAVSVWILVDYGIRFWAFCHAVFQHHAVAWFWALSTFLVLTVVLSLGAFDYQVLKGALFGASPPA